MVAVAVLAEAEVARFSTVADAALAATEAVDSTAADAVLAATEAADSTAADAVTAAVSAVPITCPGRASPARSLKSFRNAETRHAGGSGWDDTEGARGTLLSAFSRQWGQLTPAPPLPTLPIPCDVDSNPCA